MAGQRQGWTFGERGADSGGREWLIVLGSYWRAPVLHETEQAAHAEMAAHPQYGSPHVDLTVAHVTEYGRTYRVTEPA